MTLITIYLISFLLYTKWGPSCTSLGATKSISSYFMIRSLLLPLKRQYEYFNPNCNPNYNPNCNPSCNPNYNPNYNLNCNLNYNLN